MIRGNRAAMKKGDPGGVTLLVCRSAGYCAAGRRTAVLRSSLAMMR
jgi:hypothetical protein